VYVLRAAARQGPDAVRELRLRFAQRVLQARSKAKGGA
jgi:hypothetical protein